MPTKQRPIVVASEDANVLFIFGGDDGEGRIILPTPEDLVGAGMRLDGQQAIMPNGWVRIMKIPLYPARWPVSTAPWV
ncbi:MAG: hypothetical protein JJU29_01965 [Verrucomicrobia bacterium]|nr:hypothetical protein [Verrucomicrobiota bacterium]MCH8512271.1 hypothetical protein [Kiritimatiellia bacterium]